MLSNRYVRRIAGLAAVAGLCAVVTACGNSSGSQAADAAPPTSVPPTTVPDAPAPTTAPAPADAPLPAAAARPTQNSGPAPTQATPPASAVETAAASLSSGNGAVRLVLDGSASQASYHAHEQLVGNTLPTSAVGTSPGVSGSLVFGADGSIAADQSTVTVDLTQLKSDESRRDNYIRNNTLETSKYPTATFVARDVQGLSTPLPTSGTATFQLLGDLTVHGVTKPVTWQVTAQFADSTVNGSATTNVNISDFGMKPPKVGPVLSIEDGLNLELAFTANRAA